MIISALERVKKMKGLDQGLKALVLDWGKIPAWRAGGPVWTVPELLFEKKGLIPALQELLGSSK